MIFVIDYHFKYCFTIVLFLSNSEIDILSDQVVLWIKILLGLGHGTILELGGPHILHLF